jgi:hypothetical protein
MADTSLEELWPVQIDIIGPTVPVAERSTFQMRAIVTFEDNSQHEVLATWSAIASPFGSISADGLFTGGTVPTGTRSVQVSCLYYHAGSDSTLTSTTIVTVRDIDTPPTLVSIVINGKGEVEKNTVETYVVTARYDDSSTVEIVPTTFTSSRPSIATIDTTGIAHFQKIRGSALVRFTATYIVAGITRTAILDVLVVDSAIYPVKGFIFGPSIITELGRANFGFEVLFDNGKNQQVIATWMHTNPKAGEISCDGTFCANAVNGVENTTIIASYDFEGTVTSASIELSVLDITVRPEYLSIDGPARVREGLVVQYYTTVHFTDGTKKAVQSRIHTNTIAGSIDDGNQLYAAPKVEAETSVNLMAVYEDLQVTRNIEVVPALSLPASCYIELRSPMHVGEYQLLKFHVVYEDGADIVLPAKWEISNEYIANISNNGVLHAVQVVETAELVIRASTSISGVDLMTELPVTLIDNKTFPLSIRIEGPESIRANTANAYVAVATFSDGSERVVSPLWFCSDELASVSFGSVNANVPGTYNVSVSYTLQHETVTTTKEIIAL